MHRIIPRLRVGVFCALLVLAAPAPAADTVSYKGMSMELAADIARAAVEDCRERGYQVSAVVVDRSGNPQILMRDALASRFTVQIAEEKANAVVLSGVGSGEFRDNRSDIRQEMNQVDGILMLEGGLPIEAAGAMLGAVGVSGAPGGDLDAACARAGLDSVQERLDFAD